MSVLKAMSGIVWAVRARRDTSVRREKSDALNALAGKEWMEVERERTLVLGTRVWDSRSRSR